jgi:hypothetical protein
VVRKRAPFSAVRERILSLDRAVVAWIARMDLMNKKSSHFLDTLLTAAVEEWGIQEIEHALSRIREQRAASTPKEGGLKPPEEQEGRSEPRQKKFRAVDQIAKLNPPEDRLMFLRAIAERFDNKTFLPTAADIRLFLSMIGDNGSGVRDRPEGFRKLAPRLAEWAPSKLEELVNSKSYSGPARLGPLAEAIERTGVAIRRSDSATAID